MSLPQGTVGTAVNPTNWNATIDAVNANSIITAALSSELQSLTAAEIQQLQNINTVTISNGQWTIVGGMAATLTVAEVNFLDGVTSAIQTQLNAKAADADVLKKDGSVALTANWNAGSFSITFSGALICTVGTFSADDLTPSVSGGVSFLTNNASAKTITQFDDGVNGQIINIIAADDNTTIASNANIKHNAGSERVMGQYDVAKFIHNGTLWVGAGYEQNSV